MLLTLKKRAVKPLRRGVIMVRVFLRFMGYAAAFVLAVNSGIIFSSDEASPPCEGVKCGNLKSNLKKSVQESYQRKIDSRDALLKAWLAEAAEQISSTVKEVKNSEEILRRASASVNPTLAAEIISGLNPEVQKILNQVADKGWQESLASVKALLDEKNLYLGDLFKDPKLLALFVKKLAEEEKNFWKLKAKAEASTPISETKVEIVPAGELAQGLKLLGVLKFFLEEDTLKESFKLEEQPTLLRIILELK